MKEAIDKRWVIKDWLDTEKTERPRGYHREQAGATTGRMLRPQVLHNIERGTIGLARILR